MIAVRVYETLCKNNALSRQRDDPRSPDTVKTDWSRTLIIRTNFIKKNNN